LLTRYKLPRHSETLDITFTNCQHYTTTLWRSLGYKYWAAQITTCKYATQRCYLAAPLTSKFRVVLYIRRFHKRCRVITENCRCWREWRELQMVHDAIKPMPRSNSVKRLICAQLKHFPSPQNYFAILFPLYCMQSLLNFKNDICKYCFTPINWQEVS
jgi:hypothetical protein